MESSNFGTKSLAQINSISDTSDFMDGRKTDTASSSDSAIISASISETSDDEFEFPPLPLILPPPTPVIILDENDAQPPPPLPLAFLPINHSETSSEWDNESGFQNDDNEFPPPPPECFSTMPETLSTDRQESVNLLSDDTSCSPKLDVKTIITSEESKKLKLPSSFCNLTGSFKVPFLEDKPSQKIEEPTNSEGNLEKNVQKSNDSSIEENQKPFARLFKQLDSEASADKTECNPADNILNAGNFNETIEESGILPDCEQSKTSENIASDDASFVDANPPPLFVNEEESKAADSVVQDAVSPAKAQLNKDSRLNNIVKEYYSDASNPDQTKNKETKAQPNTPIIDNAPLPQHLKDGSKSEMTDISDFRRISFDATIGEMKCLMSGCDEKATLASSKRLLGTCRGNLSKSTSIDSYSDTGYKNESASNCLAITQTRNIESAHDSELSGVENQKVKLPTAPKTFRLKKAPKVLGFTEEQIKTTLELQKSTKLETHFECPNSKIEETSEICNLSSSNDQVRCNMSHQNSLVQNEELESLVEDKESSVGPNNSEANQSKVDVMDKTNLDTGTTSDYKCMEVDNNSSNGINSEIIRCIPMTDTNLRNVIFGHGKCPNVKGFTEEQIKSLSLELGKNCTIDPENVTKNKVDDSSSVPVDDLVTSQGNDVIRIVKFGRRLQESKKIFESADKVDDGTGSTKVTGVKRSTSAASIQRKPIQIRPIEKSIELESNFSKRSVEEYGPEPKCIAEHDKSLSKGEVKVNEDKSDEILAVSEAKAFFESIKPSQGIRKPDRILPKKSSTFSVNKTSSTPRLQGLRQKYQNQSNLISEERQSIPSENKEPKNTLNATNSMEETTNFNGESIDAASHLPVESLVTKFGTLKKTPSKKGVLEKCAFPESNIKLPGKSLSNADLEPKKFVANQNPNKQAWKSFMQTYSEK